MHNHKKKALSEKIKLLNFSHCCNSFQISICRLNSALNSTYRRHTRQVIKLCKKEASLQMKDVISNQKISLKRNRNIRINSQDAQTAQKTVKDLKLHCDSIVIRQDRADSIFASKKNARL